MAGGRYNQLREAYMDEVLRDRMQIRERRRFEMRRGVSDSVRGLQRPCSTRRRRNGRDILGTYPRMVVEFRSHSCSVQEEVKQ